MDADYSAAGGGTLQAGDVPGRFPLNEESLGPPAGSREHRVNVGERERSLSLGLGTALCLAGVLKGRAGGLLLAVGGGSLIYRGVTGYCFGYEALGIDSTEHSPERVISSGQGQQAEKAMSINASPEELYGWWRDVENLAEILPHVSRVSSEDARKSHWVARGPLNRTLEWDAEIFNERENELIAWRSIEGGDVETAGSVRFKPLGRDRGTEVRLTLRYNPPGGRMGAMVAFLGGYGLKHEITEALRNLKRRFEAGEVPRKNEAVTAAD